MKKYVLLILIGVCGFISCQKSGLLDSKLFGKSQALANSLGTTYYVDPSGNDSNTGMSPADAWKTVANINAKVFSPGDQILFKSGGVWNDTLNIKGSGTADAPIIIDKYDGEARPVINGGGKRNGSSALLLNKVSHCIVNNLEITNTVPTGVTYAAIGIRVTGGTAAEAAVNNIVIKNCYIHDVNGATDGQTNFSKASGGIILIGKIYGALIQSCRVSKCSVEGIRTLGINPMSQWSKDIIIDNNLVENIYGDGIVLAGVSGGSKITHNTVYKACMNTGAQNYAGVWTISSKNSLIAYNEVYGMTGGGGNDGMAFDADGYDSNSVTDGDTFEYNYSHDNNGGFMLFMTSAKNITVRYNVSVNDVGTTRLRKLFLIQKSNNNSRYVYNNVFYLKNPVASIVDVGSSSGKPYCNFSNNIFYALSTITNVATQQSDGLQFNNNCFYPTNTFSSLNWGTIIRNDNFYADPSFINPIYGSGFDVAKGYDVSANSPVRNAGIVITNNGGKDFSGNSLPVTNPDVGAFQHAVISQAGSTLADAYVRNGSYAGANYGSVPELPVKSDATSYARKSYVKFDISAVTKPKVSSAILKMYVSNVNTAPQRTINIYTTNTTSWLENTISWNNAPMDTVLVGKIVVSGIGMQTIDVTKAINKQLIGTDRNVSFLFLNTGAFSSIGNVSFNSKEATTNRPVLELQY
ncbi:CBM96 family carbohydrate-binding protein [Sphingobacterium spiritivorum]|uniref:CBM96 family carbohydrate-binding protein n=1 Tax=Sphingobacterium spiritivorum TaxID=258 RepID=UPI003DA273EE